MFKTKILNAALALSGVILVSGCAQVNKLTEQVEQRNVDARDALKTLPHLAGDDRVVVSKRVFLPGDIVKERRDGQWLRSIQVSLQANGKALAVSQIASMLSAQGINVISDLPLSSYMYSGNINSTDAETALKLMLGTVGLDYKVDDAKRLIIITPLQSKTWFFNIGRRTASFSTGGGGGIGGGAPQMPQPMPQAQAPGMLGMVPGAPGSQPGGMMPAMPQPNIGSAPMTSNGGMGVQASDNFWSSLEGEIKARLSVLMPSSAAPSAASGGASAVPAPPPPLGMPPIGMPPLAGMPQPASIMPAGQDAAVPSSGVTSWSPKTMGAYSINPETGAVRIQAPHWILEDLDKYFTRVRESYNADLTFTGELVLVSTNRSDSEGVDLAAFAKWASGKYGAFISNNALGGVTLSFPTNGEVPTASASNPAIAGPLLGIKKDDAIKIFNAYLTQVGRVSVLQRPVLTTTNGVPAEFNKVTPKYYNTVSQQVASSTTNAAVGTTNQLNSVDLGTVLRINPRLDMSTGLIRTQISLSQVTSSGNQQVPQTITVGTGSQTITASIPIVTKLSYSGETLLKDGDMIIVGGQTDDTLTVDENGLPTGRESGPMGGLFGTKVGGRGSSTYYFVLQVKINRRS